MKITTPALALFGAMALAAGAQAQTASPTTAPSTTPTTSPMINAPVSTTGHAIDKTLGTNTTGTNPGGSNAGPAAASGDTNQAVATTNANAPQPAHGANSFTAGQARRRLQKQGYQHVAGLKKDSDGVWRGTATKDGAQADVWVDYKGNVGTR